MARVLITPVKSSEVEPFEVSGKLTSKVINGEQIFYIGGRSYPESIVTILQADEKTADMIEKPKRKGA
jgi:hypothetical protein